MAATARPSPPRLQLALDFVDLDEAFAVADAAAPHVDLLEAGTPLIKAAGIAAVTRLKDRFPDKDVVADMKTMDTGFLEAELAFTAGANVSAVLGVADRATIAGAAEAARRAGRRVAVDSIGVADLDALLAKVRDLDVWCLLVHVGIDEQGAGRRPLEVLGTLRHRAPGLRLAVAGGLSLESIPGLAAHPEVDIVVVGSAITRTGDPATAAAAIRAALDGLA